MSNPNAGNATPATAASAASATLAAAQRAAAQAFAGSAPGGQPAASIPVQAAPQAAPAAATATGAPAAPVAQAQHVPPAVPGGGFPNPAIQPAGAAAGQVGLSLATLPTGDAVGVACETSLVYHQYAGVFIRANSLDHGLTAYIIQRWMSFVNTNQSVVFQAAAATPNATNLTQIGGDALALPQFSTLDHVVNSVQDATYANLTADMRGYFALYNSLGDKPLMYLRDLVACNQVRELKTANVESYFASLGKAKVNARSIVEALAVISTAFGNLVSQNAALGDAAVAVLNPGATSAQVLAARKSASVLTNAPFIEYHTTASSTPALCKRMCDDLGAMRAAFISDAVANVINDAFRAQHDLALSRLIPAKAIVVTSAYLTSMNSLPEGWKQGQRAVASHSPIAYRAMTTIFKKYATFAANLNEAEAATNMAELVAAIPPGLFT